jgi:hypothetical protein
MIEWPVGPRYDEWVGEDYDGKLDRCAAQERIGSLISSPDSVGIEYSPTLWLALRSSSQALELVIGPYLLK